MNNSRLDLNLLVSLDVLLAEGNVTRAAKRLGLSQPALSAQLKQLRNSFDDPLLIPSSRGMTLTSRAEALREPLREALAQIQALTAGARTFDPASTGQTFRIVASDAIHHAASALLAARLGNRAPGCRIALLPYDGARTQEQMATGEIDLWLGAQSSMPPNLRARTLYEEHFLCVMRRDHPLAARPLDLDRFCALEHVLVSPTGGGFHGIVDESLAAMGRSRRVTVSLNSFLLVPAVIAESELVATVPSRLARAWAQQLDVLAPPCEIADFTIMMGWHSRAHADPAQVWLRQQLMDLLIGEVQTDSV
ncbi:LysR family transcriptional regulator [Crenobacter sp. SG2303]|uniref:LysR family transcriptional regulator n=1 Tax=Crenobacter oryzisoli TaxID=3056844 RepID=A0ABT7XSC4_9NEIS|nr:LysR family transcriptional regulator [Crenobacter sp. SG2303]MDN0076613.1 LysR family transcriptional regulator [Crenobacter sp. SG2303]